MACMAPVLDIASAVRDFGDVGVHESRPVAKRPLVLPRDFGNPDLLAAIGSKSTPQSIVDAKMSALLRGLPIGSGIFEFGDSIIHRRSLAAVIPGDSEDLFVHAIFGMKEYIVIRSVKKIGGKELTIPRMEFFYTERRNPTVGVSNVERCISCHRGGTIALKADPGSVRSYVPGVSADQITSWFEKIRPKYADLSNYDFSHLGPEMGPEDPPSRTDDFIRECATRVKPDLTSEDIHVIKRQMNCYECHLTDGPGTELLRFPMHAPDFGFDIFDNIISSGYMPKEPKTPEKLREALLTCLKAEYFGGFSDETYSQGNSRPGILLQSLQATKCKEPNPSGDSFYDLLLRSTGGVQ